MGDTAYGIAVVSTAAVALVLCVRRPRHPVTIVMALFAIGGLWGFIHPFGDGPSHDDDLPINLAMWALTNPMVAPLLTVFPEGPRGRLGRRMLALQAVAIVWTFATGLAGYERDGNPTWYFIVDQVLLVALAITVPISTASLGRLWRSSTGARRTRIGIVFSVAVFWVAQVVVFGTLSLGGGHGPIWLEDFLDAVNYVVILGGVPVAIGLGVLVERPGPLAGAMNRALSWFLLGGIVSTGALLVAGAVASMSGQDPPDALAVVVPAVAATVVAGPLRAVVRRPVDAFLPRVRPGDSALHGLSDRLAGPVTPSEVPAIVASTLAEAFDATGLELEMDGEIVARWGAEIDHGAALTQPLIQSGRTVGVMRFQAAEPPDRSLDLVMPHVAAALESAHLVMELERSHDRLLSARADERSRLRADLHDELSPALAGMRLAAASIRERLHSREGDADPIAVGLLARIEAEAGDSVHTVRQILAGLRPLAIDDLGVYSALRQRAMTFDRPGTFEVVFSAGDDLPELDPDIEVALYRTLGEAVNNSARHSRARRCTIRIGVAEGAAVMDVTDDGVGVSEDAAAVGLGVRSMQARARRLGGQVRIEPVIPAGTRVVVVFPLGEVSRP